MEGMENDQFVSVLQAYIAMSVLHLDPNKDKVRWNKAITLFKYRIIIEKRRNIVAFGSFYICANYIEYKTSSFHQAYQSPYINRIIPPPRSPTNPSFISSLQKQQHPQPSSAASPDVPQTSIPPSASS